MLTHSTPSTEMLTKMIEAEEDLVLVATNPREYRDKIVQWTAYCNKRAEVLLDHCAEGYERREWKFVDPALTIS